MSFDGRTAGTAKTVWDADPRLAALPAWPLPTVDRVVVVAAHPDDEALGAGGLIATAISRGIEVRVVMVTDGAGSPPVDPTLPARRRGELAEGLRELGVTAPVVHLDVPDAGTPGREDAIAEAVAVAAHGEPGRVLLVCPWPGDGHRDHRVVGETVAAVARRLGHPAVAYPIWLWHWGRPETAPWADLVALPLSAEASLRKHRSIARHLSQTTPPAGAGPSELHPRFLLHFDRDVEVLAPLTGAARADDAESGLEHFEALYERHADPWGYLDRWYEERKRSLTLGMLRRERYDRVLEIGCSIGVLTGLLAERGDTVLGLDMAEQAVRRARERLRDRPGVTVERRDVRDGLPDGPFDLIVVSEVGYYLDAGELASMLEDATARLADGGELLAAHWRHPGGAPLHGDDVDAAVARLSIPVVARYSDEDVVVTLSSGDRRSVARSTGVIG